MKHWNFEICGVPILNTSYWSLICCDCLKTHFEPEGGSVLGRRVFTYLNIFKELHVFGGVATTAIMFEHTGLNN